jgi:aminopeptidase N
MQLNESEVTELCYNQLQSAHNITDVMVAFTLLSHKECEERKSALAAFENQWRDDPLVIDEWFSVQAIFKRSNTLNEVTGLVEHPFLSIDLPIKERSLIDTFLSANLIRFHAANGASYRLSGEPGTSNPQIASRMMRLMSRWQHSYEPRQQLVKNVLDRIIEVDVLFRDHHLVASKNLP